MVDEEEVDDKEEEVVEVEACDAVGNGLVVKVDRRLGVNQSSSLPKPNSPSYCDSDDFCTVCQALAEEVTEEATLLPLDDSA